eukprot:TRINITY_DN18430_c0_g1_i2.p1 TRINITY_DN18430_c0_g1~~TRINITY_DN18430_c0_g1_i2.p1  ORF type:complete len:1697 (+),score=574.62 TRINITY_DN18430_c0_g1_i2:130-5220(+)
MKVLSQLDALESSVSSVFQRLNLDSLTEQAERLRLHQESLQREMARKNSEHNIQISEQINTRLPHIAKKSELDQTEGSPMPDNHGGISPARIPDAHDSAQRQQSATASSMATHEDPHAASTLSRASQMIQRARQQRTTTPVDPASTPGAEVSVAAPSAPMTEPPGATGATGVPAGLGRASPPAPPSPQRRNVSPVRRDTAAVADASFMSQQLSLSNILQLPAAAPYAPMVDMSAQHPHAARPGSTSPMPHRPAAHTHAAPSLFQNAQQPRMPSLSAATSVQPLSLSPAPAVTPAQRQPSHPNLTAPIPAMPAPTVSAALLTPTSGPMQSPPRMPSMDSTALSALAYRTHSVQTAGRPADLVSVAAAQRAPTQSDLKHDALQPSEPSAIMAPTLSNLAARTPSVRSMHSGTAPLAVGDGATTPTARSGLGNAAHSLSMQSSGGNLAQELELARKELQSRQEVTQKAQQKIEPLETRLEASPAAASPPADMDPAHREALQMAFELHAQQEQRIREMEQLLEAERSGGAGGAASPSVGDVPMVMEELKKIQQQNDKIADKLTRADEKPTTPSSSMRHMTPPRFPPPGSRRRPSQTSNEDATWSPSTSIRGGARGVGVRKGSEFPGLPPPSDSGDDDIDPVAHLVGGRRPSASLQSGGSKYSYTRHALGRKASATPQTRTLVGPRRKSSDTPAKHLPEKQYAFGSTVKVKVAVNAHTHTSAQHTSKGPRRQGSVPPQERAQRSKVISPPPNRHRLGVVPQQRQARSVARSTSAGGAGRGWATRETPPQSVVRSHSDRTSERHSDSMENRCDRERSPTRLPPPVSEHVVDRAGLDAPMACLVLPLPNCCRTLPLSDEGLTPQSLAKVAQLHLSEVVNHYVEWLNTGASPPEMEEAAAMLSILPLSSLASHTFGVVCRAVINLLVDFASLGQDLILYLLRVLRLLCTSRSHERLPQWNVVITVLIDILRHPDCVTLIPSVVNSLIAFGTNGLSVLLKEASARPPQHDPCLLQNGAVSGWNSLILTLLANQTSVINNIVVPLVLRDLRDGTPERAEAACNALIGLAHFKPKVLPQLGESLTAGKFDRRVACMAIRMIGGDEGVSMLQNLLSHHSHKVRQAAVWGLGLHAPGDFEQNPDFDTLPTDHQPKPPFSKFNAQTTTVVHAELAALDVAHSARMPPPVLYFQPQLTPDCPPYIETHIIIDACVMLQQCSDLARNDSLDLSVGAQPQTKIAELPQPQDGDPVRYTFMAAAKALAVPAEVDMRTTSLFLGTFRPVTGGRGVLSPSLVNLQRTLKTLPPAAATKLPNVTRTVVSRVVGVLVNLAAGGGDTQQEVKVKEEALHVLRWFSVDDIEPALRALTGVLDGNHPTLRSAVVVLLSEVLRRGRERGSTSDVTGMAAVRLNDSHPRVRLASAIALRSAELPRELLPVLLHCLRDGKINRHQVAHTVACIVPKGVQALVDAANAQSIEDHTRKACIYGIGRVSQEALHTYPHLNESVSDCLAFACSEMNAVEVREQALLSLGCVSGVLEAPMDPPTGRVAKAREDQFTDAKRKTAVLLDKACELLGTDEPRVRDLAAKVLALSGKRGVCLLQEAILKPKIAVAASRLSAVKALPAVANKATMFKTALLATDDTDGAVRCEAHNALFSSPVRAIAADLRQLPATALHDVKAACSVVLGRTRHTLPAQTVQLIQDLLQQLSER